MTVIKTSSRTVGGPTPRSWQRHIVPSWQAERWRPVEIVSAGSQDGANFIEWLDPDGDGAPFRAYAREPVSIAGATVASLMPWDATGRSVLSFVELDSEAPRGKRLEVSRNLPTEGRAIHERLNILIAEAEELGVSATDIDVATRRIDAIDHLMTRWAVDLPPNEVEPYRERYRQAQTALAAALADAVGAKERLILEAEALAGSAEPDVALARFEDLKRRWENGRLVQRSTEVKLRARFYAFEQFIVGALRRDRERAEHVSGLGGEDKLHIIEELKALIGSPAEATSSGQIRDLYQQRNAADRVLRMIESELAERLKVADESIRSGWGSRQTTHDDA